VSGITPLLLTSIFPAEIRARCVGFVYHAGAFLAAFVPTAIAAMSEFGGWRIATAMFLIAAVAKVLTLGVLYLRPGRVLEAQV